MAAVKNININDLGEDRNKVVRQAQIQFEKFIVDK